MDQIFNELSASACYPDKYAAQAGMENAIDTSLSLANLGMSKTIRTTREFTMCFLSTGYSIAEWVRDGKANREKKQYFLTYATKSPYIENFFEAKEQDEELFEFRFGHEKALGLGLAYLWDTSTISFNGDNRFADCEIDLVETKVTSNEEIIKNISVLTFSKVDQIELYKDNIIKSLSSSINNGRNLIDNAKQTLTFLSFCPKAINQIKNFRGSEQFFPEVVNHLFILNDTMREWKGGIYSPNLDFSTESPSTMNNPEYAQQRTFLCDDNIERQFKLHSKIKSANKRIYFFPLLEQRVVHIGYIGDHLPTKKFAT